MTSPAPMPNDLGSACPDWCTAEHTPDGDRRHQALVGGFWQREHRTGTGRTVRPAGGLLNVGLRLVEDREGALQEDTVTLELVEQTRAGILELTNGEARRLLALLEAAVARLDGIA